MNDSRVRQDVDGYSSKRDESIVVVWFDAGSLLEQKEESVKRSKVEKY